MFSTFGNRTTASFGAAIPRVRSIDVLHLEYFRADARVTANHYIPAVVLALSFNKLSLAGLMKADFNHSR